MPSKIEWTEETWNPLAGCSECASGCQQCYAVRQAHRMQHFPKYAGTTYWTPNGNLRWTGKINLDYDALEIPLRRKKPTTWFVNSMSDLFHPEVPFSFVDRVFAVMALCLQHRFQILTKRPERMADYLEEDCIADISGIADEWYINGPTPHGWHCDITIHDDGLKDARYYYDDEWPLPNVWIGTSCSTQKDVDVNVPHLLRCPAAIRFLSLEPLLAPIKLQAEWLDCQGEGEFDLLPAISWVIAGGESGPGARPCSTEWIRSIVRQCREAGVACFVKQVGAMAYQPIYQERELLKLKDSKGGDPSEWPKDLRVREMPK